MTVIPAPSSITGTPATDLLADMPEERVWLPNFTSSRTRQTYANAVRELTGFLGVERAEDFHCLTQAHIIACREQLTEAGASPRTISNRLSAVSSLFAHLCEKQLCELNPVSGVRRPKVASHSVETPALSFSQVRAMFDAPDANTLQGLCDRALLHVYFWDCCIRQGRLKRACHVTAC